MSDTRRVATGEGRARDPDHEIGPSCNLFAVIRTRGPEWDPGRPMRRQRAWREHAAFMDALTAERFVVLGGPLGRGERILLVVEASSERAVRRRLAQDPWEPMGLLRTESVDRWQVLLERESGPPKEP